MGALSPYSTDHKQNPTTSFDKWQLDLLLLLLLHHGPILGGHFHEADVKADAYWGRPALRVHEEVRPPNINSNKNI